MSTTRKTLVFLGVTFAFSWAVTLAGWSAGLARSPVATVAVLALMMAGPAIGALVCAFAFEKGRRIDSLGLRFRPNAWWFYAWLIPLAIGAGSVVFTALFSPHHLVDPAQALIAGLASELPPAKLAELRALPLDAILAVQVAAGSAINAVILTFTEELGWRGYLHSLWRPHGFWRASLATGAIWGLWHAPAIYFFGLNYPDHRLIGIPIFVVFCTLLAPLMSLIRDRGGSTWAAGIAHGSFNAVGGVSILCLSQPEFPWAGVVGAGGFVMLLAGAIAVALLAPRARGA
jgi:membrane protease YdiL (CAAX protease family)